MTKLIEIRGANNIMLYGKTFHFPVRCTSGVVMQDRFIVGLNWARLRESFPDSEYWRGVWCYDFNGNILWKVESPYYIDPDTGKKVICSVESPIDVVSYDPKSDRIIVFGRMGYELDPETGKLGDIVWKER